jgi:predicted ABC-class ATPase
VNEEERQLWTLGDLECVMVSCCSGAELQLRRADAIVLRELYPMKSDLYERARDLKREHEERARSEGTPEIAKSAGPG